jgi:hypothetical protein
VALVRWAAIALLLIEAAAAALYSVLLTSIALGYWQRHLSWLDVITQSVLLIAVIVVYVVVPAAIAVGAARMRFWWVWAGVAYQLAWAFLLTPVIVGLASDVSRVGIVGAILFSIAALGQGLGRQRPRKSSGPRPKR